jgi:excisionase family DNA binding protein
MPNKANHGHEIQDQDVDYIDELSARAQRHLEESLRLEASARKLLDDLRAKGIWKPKRQSVNKVDNKELMSPDEASNYLRVSKSYLSHDRRTKRIIPYIKLGKLIRYNKHDLDKFIERNSSI